MMLQCSVSCSGMPCWALPTQSCFGQREDWCFEASKAEKNWKRKLTMHEDMHRKHWHQREALREQAAKMTRVDSSKWTCRSCGAHCDRLAAAVLHTCHVGKKSGKGRKRTVWRGSRPLKRRRRSANPSATLPPSLPPDLQYPVLCDGFSKQRERIDELAAVSPASTLLYERSLACRGTVVHKACQWQVGDFFAWPSKKHSFGCVWSIDKSARIHAVELRRRPQNMSRECSLHKDGGGCWRVHAPLASQVVDLPHDCQKVFLMPRARQCHGASSLVDRCFQLHCGEGMLGNWGFFKVFLGVVNCNQGKQGLAVFIPAVSSFWSQHFQVWHCRYKGR